MPRLVANVAQRRIVVDDWSRSVDRVEPDGRCGGWKAKVGIRQDASLLIRWRDGCDAISVSLWTGEPEESPGAAVVLAGERLEGITRVPLCGCGEQGCADATLQLDLLVTAAELPGFVGVLLALPTTGTRPTVSNIWQGERGYVA